MPTISGELTGLVNEDQAPVSGQSYTITGTANTDDPDGFVAQSDVSNALGYGLFSINNSGVWTYTLDDGLDDVIAQSETVTESFSITTLSGGDGSVTEVVQIDIVGLNDAPQVSGDDSANLTEPLLDSGTLDVPTGAALFDFYVTDPDRDTVLTVPSSLSGPDTLGTLSISSSDDLGDGQKDYNWSYSVSASAVSNLGLGETYTDSFTVTAEDEQGASEPFEINVVIAGTNDTPTVSGATTGSLVELVDAPNGTDDALGIQTYGNTLTISETDTNDSQTVTIVPLSSSVGAFLGTMTAVRTDDTQGDNSGALQWTYSISNAALDPLDEGETVEETFTITVQDDSGDAATDSVTQDITITLTGRNDVPILQSFATSRTYQENAVNEAPLLLDDAVSFADVDENFNGADLTVSGLGADDLITLNTTGSGDSEVVLSAGNVSYGGTVIGIWSGGDGETATLVFNSEATNPAVEAVLESLAYQNTSDTPQASRDLVVTFEDSAGATDSATVSIHVVAENDAAQITNLDAAIAFDENTINFAYLTLDADMRAYDPEGNYAGGSLRVIGLRNEDFLAIDESGDIALNNPESASAVFYNGTQFATISGGSQTGDLVNSEAREAYVFTFDADADDAAVTELMRSLQLGNAQDAPTSTRSVTFELRDGDGDGTSVTTILTINKENDPLEASGLPLADSFVEDLARRLDLSALEMFDRDITDALDLVLTASSGVLRAWQSETVSVSGSGTAQLTLTGTAADLMGYLSDVEAVRFQGAHDSSAPVSLGATVSDGEFTEDLGAIVLSLRQVADSPELADLTQAVRYTETEVNSDQLQALDADVTLTHPDQEPDMAGAVLRVSGLLTEDIVGLRELGGVTLQGNLVRYNDTTIGSFAGGTGEDFTVTFGAAASLQGVEAVVEALGYLQQSDAPETVHDLYINLTDASGRGLGHASGTQISFVARTGADNPFDGVDYGIRVDPVFTDLDGDGDPDLVLGNVGGEVLAYENTQDGFVPFAINPLGNIDGTARSSPAFADVTGDGRVDLVVGVTTGSIDVYAGGSTGFTRLTDIENPLHSNPDLGLLREAKPTFVDLDQDGDLDLVVGADDGQIYGFENRDGVFQSTSDWSDPFREVTLGASGTVAASTLDMDRLVQTTVEVTQSGAQSIDLDAAYLRDALDLTLAEDGTLLWALRFNEDDFDHLSSGQTQTLSYEIGLTSESVANGAVANRNDSPEGGVNVVGIATVGARLTADTTLLSDADGLGSLSYLWLADGVAIAGATEDTYVLTAEEQGAAISVEISYTDDGGIAETVQSMATAAVSATNTAGTGSVFITGSVTEGQTLTATDTLTDADGLGTLSYRWMADGEVISGATASSYRLTQAEVGKVINVEIYYTDDGGTTERVSSAATSAVVNVNQAPVGTVSITGTPRQSDSLTADVSLTDADGLGRLSYQWQADGVDIAGATGQNYTLTQAEVGRAVSVTVSYTDGEGTQETVVSTETVAVSNVNDAPTGLVDITGTATLGSTLDADVSRLSDADGLGTLSYQWQANGIDIDGATGSSFSPDTAQLVGTQISVAVSYTDGAGTQERVASSATAPVSAANNAGTGSVSISGVAEQGVTLVANSTLTDSDGLGTLSYQWKADGTAISGATASTYTLTQDEVGKAIVLEIRYTDTGGTTERFRSEPTATVLNVNDTPQGEVTISGTPLQGSTLTALHTLADVDGLGTFTYQWKSDGIAIAGATERSFTLTQAEVGRQITVEVGYTDGGGFAESVTSSASVIRSFSVEVTGTGQTPSIVLTNLDTEMTGTEQQAGERIDMGVRANPAFGDIDGDGRPDLVIGGGDGGVRAFLNTGVGTGFVELIGTSNPFRGLVGVDIDTAPALVDLDEDGDLDVVFGNASGELIYFENITSPGAPVRILVDAENDAPSAVGLPERLAVQGLGSSPLDLSPLTLNDPDVVDLLSLRLSVTQNALITAIDAPGVTVVGSGSGELTLHGTAEALNTYLTIPSLLAFVNQGKLPAGSDMAELTLTLDDGTANPIDLGHISLDIAPGTARNSLLDVSANVVFAENEVNAGMQTIDADVDLISLSGDFSGGVLRLSGLLVEDTISLEDQGDATGQVGFDSSSGTVRFGGREIGTALGGAAGADFTVTFGDAADAQAVEAVVEALTYGNISDTPSFTRTLSLSLTDSTGVGLSTGEIVTPTYIEATGTDNPLSNIGIGRYSAPAAYDFDNDGDVDLVAGDAGSTLVLIENTVQGFTVRTASSTPFAGIDLISTSAPAFTDLNGDGVLDLAIGLSDGTISTYFNEEGVFTLAEGSDNPLDGISVGGSGGARPAFVDLDLDGDMDLVVGRRDGGVLAYERQSTGFVEYPSAAFAFLQGAENPFDDIITEGRSSPAFADFDYDGDLDLFIGDSNGGVTGYERVSTGEYVELSVQANPFSSVNVGNASSLALLDIDGDFDQDLVIGNSDGDFHVVLNQSQRSAPLSLTIKVTGENDAPTGSVTISGTANLGERLTADTSALVDADGLGELSYQWLRDGADIPDATGSTYDLVQADVGAVISVSVSYTDQLGTPESVTSAATAAVVNANDAPTGALSVSFDGSSLVVDTSGVSDADGIVSGGFVWTRNGAVISGETGASLTLGGADFGASLGVSYVFVDGGGTTEAVSSLESFLVGTAAGNTLNGGGGADVIYGLGGADVLNGYSGGDRLYGGDDGDTLYGSNQDDALYGESGDDVLNGGNGSDLLDGGDGADQASYKFSPVGVTIDLGLGTASGGTAEGDTLVSIEDLKGSGYDDVLTGDGGDNRFYAQNGADTLYGMGGNDRLFGEGGGDALYGGDGNDILEGGTGADVLSGGDGLDQVSYRSSSTGVSVNLLTGLGSGGEATGDTLLSIEAVVGSGYGDVLTGDDENNRFYSLGGDDTIYGGGGVDRMKGGSGADQLFGGDGDDWMSGGLGGDAFDGGAGLDMVSYEGGAAGVTVNLLTGAVSGGEAVGDTFSSIENLGGTDYADVLTGDAGGNRFYGFAGNDTLHGGDGVDRLLGGAGDDGLYGDGGNDWLSGGTGGDMLDGGAGTDMAVYQGSSSGVNVDLLGGTASGGDAAGDTLTSIESLVGSSYGDVLGGTTGDNRLIGGSGDDVLNGYDGADKLLGDNGDDTLNGGAGNDYMVGGAGADAFDGGEGIDQVSYIGEASGVGVNLDTGIGSGAAAGDTYANVEEVYGTRYDDVIMGDGADNRLSGDNGNDTLFGGGGADKIYGGAGDDEINGGAGNDWFVGGTGADTFVFGVDWGADIVSDYTDGTDVLDLSGTGLGFGDLALNQIGNNVLISDASGNSIRLDTELVSNITADDFIFAA